MWVSVTLRTAARTAALLRSAENADHRACPRILSTHIDTYGSDLGLSMIIYAVRDKARTLPRDRTLGGWKSSTEAKQSGGSCR